MEESTQAGLWLDSQATGVELTPVVDLWNKGWMSRQVILELRFQKGNRE